MRMRTLLKWNWEYDISWKDCKTSYESKWAILEKYDHPWIIFFRIHSIMCWYYIPWIIFMKWLLSSHMDGWMVWNALCVNFVMDVVAQEVKFEQLKLDYSNIFLMHEVMWTDEFRNMFWDVNCGIYLMLELTLGSCTGDSET